MKVRDEGESVGVWGEGGEGWTTPTLCLPGDGGGGGGGDEGESVEVWERGWVRVDDTRIMPSKMGEMKIRVWEEGRDVGEGMGRHQDTKFFFQGRK